MIRWGSSGGCLLVALFCVYGFLAAGEYQGTREIAWKAAYALLGAVAVLGALCQAARGK